MRVPITAVFFATAARLVIGAWLTGCEAQPEAPPPGIAPTVQIPSSSEQAVSPSATVESEAPWFVGRWRGTYSAKQLRPARDEGAGQQMAWLRDKGKRFVGDGTIDLRIDSLGRASGSASGPLGESRIAGLVDQEQAALSWLPASDDLDAFSGTLLLARDDQPGAQTDQPGTTEEQPRAAEEQLATRNEEQVSAAEEQAGAPGEHRLGVHLNATSGDGKWVRQATAWLSKSAQPASAGPEQKRATPEAPAQSAPTPSASPQADPPQADRPQATGGSTQ